jgi:hypothetical protein
VLRGELHRGHNGAAGELDYARVGLAEDIDPCAEAVSTLARALGAPAPHDPRSIFAAARTGDLVARDVVENECRRIALHIVPLAAVTDIGLVVLGGGIGSNGDLLYDGIRDLLRSWLPSPPRVEASSLGDAAVLTGLAVVGRARERLRPAGWSGEARLRWRVQHSGVNVRRCLEQIREAPTSSVPPPVGEQSSSPCSNSDAHALARRRRGRHRRASERAPIGGVHGVACGEHRPRQPPRRNGEAHARAPRSRTSPRRAAGPCRRARGLAPAGSARRCSRRPRSPSTRAGGRPCRHSVVLGSLEDLEARRA